VANACRPWQPPGLEGHTKEGPRAGEALGGWDRAGRWKSRGERTPSSGLFFFGMCAWLFTVSPAAIYDLLVNPHVTFDLSAPGRR